MRITKRQLRKIIIEHIMSEGYPGELESERAAMERLNQAKSPPSGIFSIRLVSPGPAYFVNDIQLDIIKTGAINDIIEDEQTGEVDYDLIVAVAKLLGCKFILDENMQELGMEYKPVPVDQYAGVMSQI